MVFDVRTEDDIKVAVIVPRRGDGGRRDELWKFICGWLKTHHRWDVITGDSPTGPFNRGAAINDAASYAISKEYSEDEGAEVDVLVIYDGDNFTDPAKLEEAVRLAHETGKVWFPGDCYMYLDENSSNELLETPCWSMDECVHFFPRPSMFKENFSPAQLRQEPGYNVSIRNRHVSGIMAVPVSAWRAAGGFVELEGWGREDSIFWMLLEATSGTPQYLEGTILHLFHEHAASDTTREIKRANTAAYNEFKAALASPSPRALRRVAERYGHTIPKENK